MIRPARWILLTPLLMFSGPRLAASMSTAPGAWSAKRGALVFLHGLGDTPAGWSSLQFALPSIRPCLGDIEYVFPHAPTVGITINGGMEMPGWFDLYDWPIGVGSKDDREGTLASAAMVDRAVERLEEEGGIDPSRVVVGGFSQGGAVALLSAYRRRERPLAGCVALSAWLALADELDVPEAARGTPLLWAHGRVDDKVLFEQQAFGVGKLREGGVDVTAKDYLMGHESDPDEIEAVASFLDEVFFGK